MRITRLALLLAAASGGLATAAQAQQNTAPNSGPTQYAVSPSSGEAKSTPKLTQIPGSSTTGNAAGPGGTATAAQPTYPSGANAPAEGAQDAPRGSRVVPSPAQ